jgi:O-antigen biosynthesis protein
MDVSVIIPCHNAEPYLAQTVGSVLLQSRPPDEVIIVDDGSTDRSVDIARSFPSVRVLRRTCGGASKTRNFGYQLASGRMLMFLDADDVLGPCALAGLTRAVARKPGSIGICPWYRLEQLNGDWVRRPPSWPSTRHGHDYLSGWLTGRYYPPCAVLWSREAFERSGGWDERARVNNDGDIMMRALAYGTELVPAKTGEAFYRRVPTARASVSSAQHSRAGRASQIYVIQKIARILTERERLEPYRQALGEAFVKIANECKGPYPDLQREAVRLARRYGEGTWQRLRRPLSRRLMRRLPAVPDCMTALSSGPADVITYGLDLVRAPLSRKPQRSYPKSRISVPPPVSVIVPTYNRAHQLPRAIESVLSQTFAAFELLIVDDGSTDRTPSIASAYADERVHYLRQNVNQGVGAARNIGLRKSRGEFVAFLDSDDEWLPQKIECQVEQFRKSPVEVGLLYTGVETVATGGKRWLFEPAHRGDVYERLLMGNVIHSGSSVMVRRNVIRNAGFFDELIPAIEDYDYWLRIARYYRFDYIDAPLVRYFDLQNSERRSLDTRANLSARAWLYRKHGCEMRRIGVAHEFLIESARRHLVPWLNDVSGARILAAQALMNKPLSMDLWAFLVGNTLPDSVRAPLRSTFRLLRDRLKVAR